MRHEASGALLTVGWMLLAAYVAAVLIVALSVGALRKVLYLAASRLTLGPAGETLGRRQEVDHA